GTDRRRPRRCRPAAAGRAGHGGARPGPEGEGRAGSRLRRTRTPGRRGRGVRAGARARRPADAGGGRTPPRARPAAGSGAGRPRQPDADPEAVDDGRGRSAGADLRRRQRQPRRRRRGIGPGARAPAGRRHGGADPGRARALSLRNGWAGLAPARRCGSGSFQPSPATPAPGRCRYTAPPMPASDYEFIPPGSRFHALPSPFPMKRGGALHGARVAYETWGTLAPDAGNAVLVLTGLSPDAHAASGPHDPEPGWWESMLGPGKPIDTNRWFVVCVNALGSCKGSTGPASLDPATGQLYRLAFPELSIEDVADAAASVVRGLGIEQLACVIGNSMGGMTALGLLLRHPGIARSHINISGSARALPFSIAV